MQQRGFRRRAGWTLALMLGLSVSAVFGLLVGGQDAGAQVVCDEGRIEVDNATDFNAAIDCYNQNGSTEIVLLNDIVASDTAGDFVFQAVDPEIGGQLFIDGGGFTLSRDDLSGAVPAAMLGLVGDAQSAQGEVILTDLGLELGEFDTVGIQHGAPHDLRLRVVSITSSFGPSEATGIISDAELASGGSGQFIMDNSLIDGVFVGIDMRTPIYVIEASTIVSRNTDMAFFGESGLGGIGNSSLGGPVGIRVDRSSVIVQNSTILNDGAMGSATAGGNGIVTFESSIVGQCSSDQILTDTQPGPGWVDLGNNVGACLDGSAPVTQFLTDNGCDFPTPAGCPRTLEIQESSSAFGAGKCDLDSGFGSFESDQRGRLRTPVGEGCDAGAYEFGCGTGNDDRFFVDTANEFNAAIDCFNSSEGRDVAINLLSDIEVDSAGPVALFAQVTGGPQMSLPEPLGVLQIEGNSFTLRRAPGLTTPLVPVLSISPISDVKVEVFDLRIEIGPSDTVGIESRFNADVLVNDAELAIHDSVITAPASGSSATGVLIDGRGDGQTSITGTTIEGMRVGIDASRGQTVAAIASTIASSEIDVASGDVLLVSVSNSTLTAPIGLQIGTSAHFIVYSTVLGDGAAVTDDSTGAVTAISSIVGSCSAPVRATGPNPRVIDDGGNVGGCFVPGQTIDTELANNSCMFPPLFACTQTVALSPGSPAIGAGDCSATNGGLVDVDQRGYPRTPLGPGCDAGAYEVPDFMPGDVDQSGDLAAADVQILLEYLAGGPAPTDLAAADFNRDGQVLLDDALQIAQALE